MADRTKAEVFADLVARIRAGETDVASDEQRIAFIIKELKMDNNEATSFYNNVVRPSVVTQAPTPMPGGVLDPSDPGSQRYPGSFGVSDPDLLGRQTGRQQFLRGIMGATGRPLGGFGADAQGALGTAFGQFQDIDPITRGSYFTGTPERERGLRFQDFLSGGGSGDASLRQSLGNLLTGFQGGGVEQMADFMTRFPTASSAARAGIQPYLTGVAPRQRETMATNLLNLIEPRLYTQAGQFQTPEQIAGVLAGILEQIGQPGGTAGIPPR